MWAYGKNHCTASVFKEDRAKINVEMSTSKGKFYTGGLKCKYYNEMVDCLTYSSDSGGITGGILVQILLYFDEIDLVFHVSVTPFPY